MDLQDKIIKNCYYIKEKIGKTACTIDFKAHSIFSDYNKTKLKILQDKTLKLYKMFHSDMERVLEIDEYDNHTYIVFERINGLRLSEYIKREKELDLINKIYIIIRICKALEYTHENNIIHKNLNPDNIWIIWMPYMF